MVKSGRHGDRNIRYKFVRLAGQLLSGFFIWCRCSHLHVRKNYPWLIKGENAISPVGAVHQRYEALDSDTVH